MNESSNFRDRPRRLSRYFDTYPRFFLTFNTWKRQALLDRADIHLAFRQYCIVGIESDRVSVGRYVIVPDHVHLFVRGDAAFSLGVWVRGLKRAMGRMHPGLASANTLWQEGFFDHVLRSHESYDEKSNYVFHNPVRANLVSRPEDWPFAGDLETVGI